MSETSKQNKSERILEEIKKRREQTKAIDVEEEKIELVVFTLDKDYYAFYGSDIKEILPYDDITYVPGCPDFIIGIINVRGDIESVLDIHKLMGLASTKPTKNSRIVIGINSSILSGILVDSVEDVIEVPISNVKHPISTLDKSVKEFTVGGEMIYENKYVTILDIGKIFGKIVI